MSLTYFLAVPQVAARFKQEWPMPAPCLEHQGWLLLAPPISPRPQLIGIAFDYVLRFYLRRLNPLAEERGNWVAESALDRMKGNIRQAGQTVCETARARYSRFLQGEQNDDELLTSALQLAQLDFVFRAGQLPPSGEFAVFEEDIADLKQLVEGCDWEQWRARESCRLNPTFGTASGIVMGADADFHIDNILYELKTVRRPEVASKHYHQLIGYAVLNFLDNGPPIEELAIYFSRFSNTARWPAPRLSDSKYEPFLLWFCKAVNHVFHTGFLFSDLAVGSDFQSKLEALGNELDGRRAARLLQRREQERQEKSSTAKKSRRKSGTS